MATPAIELDFDIEEFWADLLSFIRGRSGVFHSPRSSCVQPPATVSRCQWVRSTVRGWLAGRRSPCRARDSPRIRRPSWQDLPPTRRRASKQLWGQKSPKPQVPDPPPVTTSSPPPVDSPPDASTLNARGQERWRMDFSVWTRAKADRPVWGPACHRAGGRSRAGRNRSISSSAVSMKRRFAPSLARSSSLPIG